MEFLARVELCKKWGDGAVTWPESPRFKSLPLGTYFPPKQRLGCLFVCLLSLKAELKGALNPKPSEIRPNCEPLQGPELFDLVLDVTISISSFLLSLIWKDACLLLPGLEGWTAWSSWEEASVWKEPECESLWVRLHCWGDYPKEETRSLRSELESKGILALAHQVSDRVNSFEVWASDFGGVIYIWDYSNGVTL